MRKKSLIESFSFSYIYDCKNTTDSLYIYKEIFRNRVLIG